MPETSAANPQFQGAANAARELVAAAIAEAMKLPGANVRTVSSGAFAAATEFYWTKRPDGFTQNEAAEHLPTMVLIYLAQFIAQEMTCRSCGALLTGAHDARCIERFRNAAHLP